MFEKGELKKILEEKKIIWLPWIIFNN
jgi:hypothetical protein